MGGNMFNSIPVPCEHVESLVWSFMTMVIPDADYIITGSFRRGAKVCGDIELVIPYNTASEHSRIQGCIATQFGCTASGTANTHGMYGQIQYDLFPVLKKHMGAMLLHSTGSYKLNKRMRTIAKERGMLLNQYGLFDRTDNSPLVRTESERPFFNHIGLDYLDPQERTQ
jgi:DNA polymerase/3'-5' exonuclease PolX